MVTTNQEFNKIYNLATTGFPIKLEDDFEKSLACIETDNKVYFVRQINDILKEVKDYYWVSTCGRIWSTYMDSFMNGSYKDGYRRVNLVSSTKNNLKTFRIHRLPKILFDYIPDYDNYQINHINGIKDDNRLDNLEWCTAKENIYHAIDKGLMYHDITDINIVHKICELIEKDERNIHIRKKFEVSRYIVQDIRKGVTFSHITKNYNLDTPMQPFDTLSLDDIKQIKMLFQLNKDDIINISYQEAANIFDVSKSVISKVKRYLKDQGYVL